jgi:hypothetical protein
MWFQYRARQERSQGDQKRAQSTGLTGVRLSKYVFWGKSYIKGLKHLLVDGFNNLSKKGQILANGEGRLIAP